MSRFWFNFFATVWLMSSGSLLWWGGSLFMRMPATSWELPTLGHLMVIIGAAMIAAPLTLLGRE